MHAILTERKVWKRKPHPQQATRVLTSEQSAHVRRVLRHLTVEYDTTEALAAALGITPSALGKSRMPSRAKSPRLAFLIARLTGVTFDDVVEGRWRMRVCCECGLIGAV